MDSLDFSNPYQIELLVHYPPTPTIERIHNFRVRLFVTIDEFCHLEKTNFWRRMQQDNCLRLIKFMKRSEMRQKVFIEVEKGKNVKGWNQSVNDKRRWKKLHNEKIRVKEVKWPKNCHRFAASFAVCLAKLTLKLIQHVSIVCCSILDKWIEF